MAAPLTATGRVILGMLSLGSQTGYEIKNFVDKTTRHFWAASYGQIYPELRRLEEEGLVRGRFEPTGGRARTVFELTDAGREALLAWLGSDTEPVNELRDEGMLKLFFSDTGDPRLRIDNIRAMRELHERTLAQLRALEPHASQVPPKGPYLTLQLGIRMQECVIDWCRATEQALKEAQ
ncbi:MAG TPA: PadR family transcriptional regulator [Solirubrobacteraceae bacterium]|nr:PadR family transcriptional regulator [Solirubrobacteraceae bacterium]